MLKNRLSNLPHKLQWIRYKEFSKHKECFMTEYLYIFYTRTHNYKHTNLILFPKERLTYFHLDKRILWEGELQVEQKKLISYCRLKDSLSFSLKPYDWALKEYPRHRLSISIIGKADTFVDKIIQNAFHKSKQALISD